jgi:acyl phosphate:glycerol-3-phosphate acyltransferase
MEYFIIIIFSYLLGSVMTGYIVSKSFAGKDIREMGSTNVGARNAGTLFGKKAFFITAIGDGLKGLIAILIAKGLGFSVELQVIVLLAVLIGHLFPIFLKFHGGKGIATFIGSLLMFNFTAFIYFLVAFIVLIVISRSATIAVLGAFVFLPFYFFVTFESLFVPMIITVTVLLLLWASRNNIIEKFNPRRTVK